MNVYGCPNSLDELEIRLGDMLTGALHSQRSSSVSLQLAAPRSQRRTVLVLQFSCEAFVYIITLRPHLSYIVYTYPRVCVCVCVCVPRRTLSVLSCSRKNESSVARTRRRPVAVASSRGRPVARTSPQLQSQRRIVIALYCIILELQIVYNHSSTHSCSILSGIALVLSRTCLIVSLYCIVLNRTCLIYYISSCVCVCVCLCMPCLHFQEARITGNHTDAIMDDEDGPPGPYFPAVRKAVSGSRAAG